MHKDNTPNFQTKLSNLTHFKDFLNKSEDEKEELKKVKRSFADNEGELGNVGNKTKYKYNKVTRKMDDLSKPEVQDDIESLNDLEIKNKDHKYKIKESSEISDDLKSNFRSWEKDCNTLKDVESLTNILSERYPEMDKDNLKTIAADWVGFNLIEDNIETFENFNKKSN